MELPYINASEYSRTKKFYSLIFLACPRRAMASPASVSDEARWTETLDLVSAASAVVRKWRRWMSCPTILSHKKDCLLVKTCAWTIIVFLDASRSNIEAIDRLVDNGQGHDQWN